MAISDWIYKIKDGWDRVVGGFLHGEQEESGYTSYDNAYYTQQNEGNEYSYGYGHQEMENNYAQGYQGQDNRISPYAGSYAQQLQDEPAYGQEYYQEPHSAPVMDNMVAFPGVSMDQVSMSPQIPSNTQIVQLKDRETCKAVIEALRSNASVLINMETIASDMEKQRCVDMLGGAAYTLNCQISKVSIKGVYFISSQAMQVEMDEATRRLNGLARANQGRSENPLYKSQRPPAYRDGYEEYNANYQQSEYAAPYGTYQGNDGYGQQAVGGGYGPYAGTAWS